MAVALDGFSIREYAAKMRSLDVMKCWPFSDNKPTKEQVHAFLPPITVTKFRWWSHQLQPTATATATNTHQETTADKSEIVCSTCRAGTGTRTIKSKSKQPKKRSIADIFAVIDTIQQHKQSNNTKQKKKKKNTGNAQKLKLKKPVKFAKKLKKRFATDILNSVSSTGKKPSRKRVSREDKEKVVEEFELIGMNQNPTFPVRSILKNHLSCEQKSTNHVVQCSSKENPCGTQLSERHVRFSGKDDILGPGNEDSCSSEKNDGRLLSDVLSASSEKLRSAEEDMEVSRSDNDASILTDNRTEVQTIIGIKQFPQIHQVDMNSPRLPISNQDRRKFLPEKTIQLGNSPFCDSNFQMFDQGYPNTAFKPPFTAITPRLFSNFGGSCENAQVGSSLSRNFNSSGNLINLVHDPTYGVASMQNKSQFLEPLSCFGENENANQRLHFQSLPVAEKINDQTSRYQPFYRLPPADLMGSFPSLPEWKQKAVALRKNVMDEDFFGLPLNSQGELIQSSSRSKDGFNQPRETNISGPSSGLSPSFNLTQPRCTGDHLNVNKKHFLEREFPNNELNLFLAQHYDKENPGLHFPARFGVTNGRADTHQYGLQRKSNFPFQPFDADMSHMNLSFDGSKQYDFLQHQKINAPTGLKENLGHMSMTTSQPTMRLMGKDVTIGTSSREMQAFEDGKLWTDKEIITEFSPSSTDLNSSSLDRNFQHKLFPHVSLGQYKETVAQSLGIHGEQAARDNLLMIASGASFPQPYLNWQTNDSFRSHSLASGRNHSSDLFPFARSSSSMMFDRTPSFQEFISGTGAEPLRPGSQLPVLSTAHNNYEYTNFRPAEIAHRQNLPQFMKPGLEYPFLNPEITGVNSQSSWSLSSNKSLPSWLLHAKQQETPIISSYPISNVVSNHRHISSRTNILNTPSVYQSAEGSYSCNPVASHSQDRFSLGSAAVALPPLVPVIPGVNPASAVNTGYRNRVKVKERLKSKALGVKDPYPYKKTNKRVPEKSVDVTRATRILNMEKQDKLIAMTGVTENLSSEMQCDLQDNSMPIHSTIHFDVVADANRIPESQRKSTKIYRL
ncbi:hypothetical protein UlMin_015050 [Ulmus minor]